MQTKTTSFVESICNVGSGFIISLIVWETVIEPVFDVEKNIIENIGITSIFTVVSITRGYIWRRLFNRREK
jgi:hypothetical protein